jgi:hypothetical protein
MVTTLEMTVIIIIPAERSLSIEENWARNFIHTKE